MRTGRYILSGSAAAAGVLAAVGLAAYGQDRSTPDYKYYQGKVSPPPPGLFPATYVRPATQPTSQAPATSWGQLPPPNLKFANGQGVVQADGRARITQPVIAGPDGVRPASASDPLPVPTIPPVSVNPPAASPDPVPPAPRTFPPVGKPPLPEPKPLNVGGAPVIEPAPAIVPAPTKPFVREPALTPIPVGPPLPAKAAPTLTVDVVAPESVGVGQPLTYELVVRNVGNSAVMDVRIEDELPARCALISAEPAADTTGDRLAWSLGAMEQGVERRIKVTVKPADEGEIRSRAIVTFAAAVEARVKVTRPKIAVALSGPEMTRVGEKVPFTIRLSNTGTGPARRVVLQVRFSDGLTHPQGQVIEAELKNLTAGETKTLTLEAVAGRPGAHGCTITALADGSPLETAKAAVTLVEPMLVVKQTGPAKCLVKGEPVFQIELSNPGTAPTDPVQLWAALPPGFDFIQASDGGQFQDPSRTVGWRLPAMAAGSTKIVSMRLKATAPADGLIRTIAQASTDAMPTGVVPAEARSGGRPLEARADTPIKAEGVPALRFEVADVEDPVEVGKEAVYEIRIMNQGTGPCTNVQIVADLAEGTVLAGQPAGPTGGRMAGQQMIFEPIPQFGVKAEAVYRVRVKGTVAGDLRFRVRLVCDQIKVPVVKEENTRFYKE